MVAMALDFALTPAGWGPKAPFVLSVWTGWLLTVGAELWIGYSRTRAA
jgi:hypothetical protein